MRSRLADIGFLPKVALMLGKFLAACGIYVAMGAVIGWCILLVMQAGSAKIWLLCLAAFAYVVAFVKIGCTEH